LFFEFARELSLLPTNHRGNPGKKRDSDHRTQRSELVGERKSTSPLFHVSSQTLDHGTTYFYAALFLEKVHKVCNNCLLDNIQSVRDLIPKKEDKILA